jgi:hypothetical protein
VSADRRDVTIQVKPESFLAVGIQRLDEVGSAVLPPVISLLGAIPKEGRQRMQKVAREGRSERLEAKR